MAETMFSTSHYWLPVADRISSGMIRHAFRGKAWDGCSAATSVCNVQCGMAQPSEMDWVQAPTCWDCNIILVEELS